MKRTFSRRIKTSCQARGLTRPYKGLVLASPSRGTEFYFTCIFCPTARKRATHVLLVANSFIKSSTCSSLRSMLKAKAFTRCLHRQSRWFPYPMRVYHRNRLLETTMQSPSGSTLGPSHPYCRNLFQRLTVLFIMIAYLGEKGNEAVEYHDSFV